MKKDVAKWCKEIADLHYYQTTEDQDKGVEKQADGEKMNIKRLHTFFVYHDGLILHSGLHCSLYAKVRCCIIDFQGWKCLCRDKNTKSLQVDLSQGSKYFSTTLKYLDWGVQVQQEAKIFSKKQKEVVKCDCMWTAHAQ